MEGQCPGGVLVRSLWGSAVHVVLGVEPQLPRIPATPRRRATEADSRLFCGLCHRYCQHDGHLSVRPTKDTTSGPRSQELFVHDFHRAPNSPKPGCARFLRWTTTVSLLVNRIFWTFLLDLLPRSHGHRSASRGANLGRRSVVRLWCRNNSQGSLVST